jgi:hypothetical protein
VVAALSGSRPAVTPPDFIPEAKMPTSRRRRRDYLALARSILTGVFGGTARAVVTWLFDQLDQ